MADLLAAPPLMNNVRIFNISVLTPASNLNPPDKIRVNITVLVCILSYNVTTELFEISRDAGPYIQHTVKTRKKREASAA